MTVATSTLLGRPLWSELMTSDPKAAETFYDRVVGWFDRTLPKFLDEPKRSEFQRMKKEFDELVKRPDPKGREMALSVNQCKASPPPTQAAPAASR